MMCLTSVVYAEPPYVTVFVRVFIYCRCTSQSQLELFYFENAILVSDFLPTQLTNKDGLD